ncbi:hypothetical protein [Actinomadura sp. 3N407]|uniref:hypothetical protein n=1 Tax=Actinomadura sp. 3N407 TaxID=3457423 RepID=UPI003FCD7805
MNLSVAGQDHTADQVDANQAGLSVMGAASVIGTDTFSETVMGLTELQVTQLGRGRCRRAPDHLYRIEAHSRTPGMASRAPRQS